MSNKIIKNMGMFGFVKRLPVRIVGVLTLIAFLMEFLIPSPVLA